MRKNLYFATKVIILVGTLTKSAFSHAPVS
jgi:hypothetical protein